MSITTSQQITRYYNLYGTIDVTFTKEVIKAVSLMTKQVYLKCLGDFWPCIIYSTSLSGARIITNSAAVAAIEERLKKANNLVSLRFCFRQNDKSDPLAFFVAAKVVGFKPYDAEHPELQFISISYTQRPPDDLIEILGRLLEANINSKKRKEERIILTKDAQRKLGIKAKETVVYIEGVPRKCIIRDLSFSGAKIITMGIAKFLLEKEVLFRLELEDPSEMLDVKGKIVRFESVEGRKDIGAIAIQFHEQQIPMSYKIRINEYLSQQRKPSSETQL